MATEVLKMMKDQLVSCVQGQLSDISRADAHELGEAVDMIKDLAEAIYYCTITESMEKSEEATRGQGETNINYYTTPYMNNMNGMYPEYRDMERSGGYMYYPTGGNSEGSPGSGGGNSGGRGGSNSGGSSSNGGGSRGGTSYYTEMPGVMGRDPREGRSPMRRRMYMEGQETHNDPNSQLKELEAYVHELSDDITEMIRDASPEEKATLRQKMTTLANKIV